MWSCSIQRNLGANELYNGYVLALSWLVIALKLHTRMRKSDYDDDDIGAMSEI